MPPSFILGYLPAQTQIPPALPPGLDYPIVAKALSPNLPHKSESGAVILNIGSGDELVAALAIPAARKRQAAECALLFTGPLARAASLCRHQRDFVDVLSTFCMQIVNKISFLLYPLIAPPRASTARPPALNE